MKKQRKNQKRRILGACLFTPLLMAASVCYMCEAESLEEQKEAAQQNLAAAQKDLAEKTQDYAELSERLSQLKGQLKYAEELVEKCEAAVEQAEKDLEESNNKYDEEIAKAEATLEKANEDLKEAEDNYALLEKQVKELENQNQNPEEAGQVEENGAQQGSKVDSVELDNKNPKVGDTITATVSPANANVSYQWYRTTNNNNIRIAGATSASYTVVAADSGSMLFCQVVDAESNLVESLATAAVGANADAGTLTIVDIHGFQSNGTAVVGDTLSVNVPTSFGNITFIQWYLNRALVQSASLNVNGNQRLPYRTRDAGEVYATVTNSTGETIVSNTVQVVTDEERAVIKGFKLEDVDEYTTYNSRTSTQMATLTFNKAYRGTVHIFRASDKSFDHEVAQFEIGREDNVGIVNADIDNNADDNVYDRFDNSYVFLRQIRGAVEEAVFNDNHWYRAALDIGENGEATYKAVVNSTTSENIERGDAALTRGEEYVAVFDQTAIVGDEIKFGNENKSESAVSPFIPAPTAVLVNKDSNGVLVATLMSESDREGRVLREVSIADTTSADQIGNNTVRPAADQVKNAAEAYDVKIYRSPNGGGINGIALNMENRIENGKKKSLDVAEPNTFYFAKAVCLSGLSGKNKVTCQSDVSTVGMSAFERFTISQDQNNPKSARITFARLMEPGTVYVFDTANVFDKDDAGSYTASKDVKAGTESVYIEEAILRGARNYNAIFVPSDNKFAQQTTTTGAIESRAPRATEYFMTPVRVTSGNATEAGVLCAVDQYGDDIDVAAQNDLQMYPIKETAIGGAHDIPNMARASLTVSEQGALTFTNGGNGAGAAQLGETCLVQLGNSQYYIKAECVDARNNIANDVWELTITTRSADPDPDNEEQAAVVLNNEAERMRNLQYNRGRDTITVHSLNNDANLIAATNSASDNEAVATVAVELNDNGDKVTTVNYVGDGEATITIRTNGIYYSRTATYRCTAETNEGNHIIRLEQDNIGEPIRN